MSEEDSNQQTEVQVAVEQEARKYGWVPKEDFRDGDHWVDAETFVKRGKEINPILRKNNETLLKKLDQANQEIQEIRQVAKDFEKFQKENAEKKVNELKAELASLKEQKKAAFIADNKEAVVAFEEAIEEVEEQQQELIAEEATKKKTSEKKEPVTLDPIITEWMEKNTWFTTDDKLTRIADTLGVSINQKFPALNGQAFFDKLDEELEEILPEKYKKKTRSNPVEGTTGSGTRTSSKKHSFENLPKEAQEACDRYIKSGLIKSRESYLADYDWN